MRHAVCRMTESVYIYGMLRDFRSFCRRPPSESMPPCQSVLQRSLLEVDDVAMAYNLGLTCKKRKKNTPLV